MIVESTAQYRNPPPAASSSASETGSDSPILSPLLARSPNLHIYTASSPAFSSIRQVLEGSVDTAPLAVIRPTAESEVGCVITFCREHGIPLSIRSGGLDIGARSRMSNTNGVMLDMRSIDSLSVDTEAKVAKLGGGVVCGSVLEFLNEQSLTTPTAFLGSVGFTAFACGGGYGLLSGTMGLGADNIVGARLVLASGEIVDTADVGTDTDILWALKGCGAGILGVVTELRVRVHACPPCLGGFVIFPYAEIELVMAGLQKIDAETSSGKLAGDSMVVNTPGIGPTLTYIYFWALNEDKSDLQEANRYLEEICKMGTVIANTVTETTPWDFTAQIPNPVAENRLSFKVCCCSLNSYSADLGKVIVANPIPNESSAIIIHNCHGAAIEYDPGALFANRQKHLTIGISGNGTLADMEKQEVRNWSTLILGAIERSGILQDWAYINFSQPKKGDGRLFYGVSGAKRLKSLKDKVDPGWFFDSSTPDLDF